MERASAAYAKPYRRYLAPLDVNTGCPITSARHDEGITEHVDHRLLERLDETAHSELRTVKVQEQIRHELTRPMVRHLPSSIGANHRNRSGVTHVAASSGLPEREDGGMFQQPEFIGRPHNPGFRTEPHRLHRRAVRHASDPASQEVLKSGRDKRVTRRVLEVHGRGYQSANTAPRTWAHHTVRIGVCTVCASDETVQATGPSAEHGRSPSATGCPPQYRRARSEAARSKVRHRDSSAGHPVAHRRGPGLRVSR